MDCGGTMVDLSSPDNELTDQDYTMITTDRIKLLDNAMLAYTWRLKALSSNLANLDTPGYQRLSVSFEETLQQNRHAIPSLRGVTDVEPRIQVEETPSSLEAELMNLADTQMRVQFSTRALHNHFEMIKSGITGRVS